MAGTTEGLWGVGPASRALTCRYRLSFRNLRRAAQLCTARCRSWAFSDTSHTYRCCRDAQAALRSGPGSAPGPGPAHRARTTPSQVPPTSAQAPPPRPQSLPGPAFLGPAHSLCQSCPRRARAGGVFSSSCSWHPTAAPSPLRLLVLNLSRATRPSAEGCFSVRSRNALNREGTPRRTKRFRRQF